MQETSQFHLATTLNNLGLLLTESELVEQAETAYLRAIALLESPSGVEPSLQQEQQRTSVQTNLSGLLNKRDPKRAIEYARDALASRTRALGVEPGNAKLATQTMVTLNILGAAQAENQQNAAANSTFQRAIEIGEQLLKRWPDQPTYRRDLVLSLNHLGLSYSKMGKLPEAREAFQTALIHQMKLTDLFPNDAELHSMLGGVLNNIGFLHRKLGDPNSADSSFRKAVEYQSIAVKLAPEVALPRVPAKTSREP